MKKFLFVVFIIALAISLSAKTIVIMNMTEGLKGNHRTPAVAENARGERVYVYRGGDLYVHYRYYRNGSWGKAAVIPGSPAFHGEFWYSDIVTDNSGTIHYVCEETDSHMWYTYFKDGAWSTMKQIDVRHEATLSLAVRSDDTVVLAAALKTKNPELTKDVVMGTKRKDQTNFSDFVNVTRDWEASTMVDLAIDAQDNSWIVYKDENFRTGSMPVTLLTLDKDHKQTYYKNVSGEEETKLWCWYARIGINTEGKVMVTWFKSQTAAYYYRCYDPATKSWSDIKEIINGPRRPWCMFYNQVLARGTDFYWIGMTPDRYMKLYKYDAAHNSWTWVGDVSTAGANWFNAYNGANTILIAWSTQHEPMSSYLTTVAVAPVVPPTVKISGKVKEDSKGVSRVTMTGLPGNPATDSSGNYSMDVDHGWTGTVMPNKSGYRFLPSSREYVNITSDQAGQNYNAIKQFNLKISATSGGTTTPPPATYPHDLDSRVTVRGNPDSSYRFDKWTGDASGSKNPITLTINKDKTIRANFIKQFNLIITATSGGTTTPPPATYPHDQNSHVTVKANPNTNYRFDKWTGDASGSSNPTTLTIDRAKTITANFIRIQSVSNLNVEKRVERSFFSGYTLNALTWEANPENAGMGLTVSAQRIYRKARAEDNTKWARIVELAGTVLKYEDRNVPSDSDYIYAVTCVDDQGNESAIY